MVLDVCYHVQDIMVGNSETNMFFAELSYAKFQSTSCYKDEAGGAGGDGGGTEGYKQDKVDKKRPCFVSVGKYNYRPHEYK